MWGRRPRLDDDDEDTDADVSSENEHKRVKSALEGGFLVRGCPIVYPIQRGKLNFIPRCMARYVLSWYLVPVFFNTSFCRVLLLHLGGQAKRVPVCIPCNQEWWYLSTPTLFALLLFFVLLVACAVCGLRYTIFLCYSLALRSQSRRNAHL